MKSRRLLAAGLALGLCLTALGCGYHIAGKGSNLPGHIETIGVPEFANLTTRPELGQRVTAEIIDQLVSRGKYKVVAETRGVDAILSGTVTSWNTKPVQLSDDTDDPEFVTVTLEASVRFDDRKLRRVTWEEEKYQFTSEYRVIGDPDEYFDTELSAVEEVAEDFARAVVSAVLQGF